MQLKKKKIGGLLATATCVLLGNSSSATENSEWDIDTAVLFYSEPDRVSAIEPVINLKKKFSEDNTLNLGLTLDTLTGASANGATATNQPQTFTRPSGNGSYTVQAGETPLDDTFKDTRVALSSSWEKQFNRLTRTTIGAAFSKEYDYTSFSVNGLLSRDFNQKNTTLQAGISFAKDQIDPVGGAPIPFASMAAPGQPQPKQTGARDKDTLDVLLGITQVLGHDTIGQLNYSLSRSSGYQTDPYKLLSVIDPVTGATQDYVYESRPEDRLKHSLYAGIKHHLASHDIIEASYRFYTDDWGIDSHTIDAKYRFDLGNERYLQPHLRFYDQTAADFYHLNLIDGEPRPENASADYRLGDFSAITAGLKFGMPLKNAGELSMRGEYYLQTGSSNGQAIGAQQGQDLYPDVDAYIIQLNYSFRW